MQMFLFTTANPNLDGDLDNGIVIHEYGHGISIRLVGGPSNVSCLNNTQQPGEGLSDWWALAYTAETGDAGTDGRGIDTYALNEPTTGPGIRTQRYSTDPAINTWTYESINGMAIPHGVGSVWRDAGPRRARDGAADGSESSLRRLRGDTPTYTDPTLTAGSTAVRVVHIAQLRAAVVALESP